MNENDFPLTHYRELEGGSSSDETPKLSLDIPEEFIGQDIQIKAIDNDTKAEATWISNLQVNDSTNTVTGTVAINRNLTSRSATITLTTGSNPNLSLATPYSFTITQSASTPPKVTWKVTWRSATGQWGVFTGTPSGSPLKFFITNMSTMTIVYEASEGPLVNDTSNPGQLVRIPPGSVAHFYSNNSGDSWTGIGRLTVPSVSKNDTI